MAELVKVATAELDAHPDNPRLTVREAVVDGIAANLADAGDFPQEHALKVRPVNGRYQIIDGHHRKAAAEKAGLSEVWAWTEEMDDDEAYMQLVLHNNQGELTPLEIGIHALGAVPLEEGGRGKKGGLSDYARKLGRDLGGVSRYRTGAVVYKALTNVKGLEKKVNELAAVHAAESDLWPDLVAVMLSRKLTVEQTRAEVAKLAEFKIPEKHADWLPPLEVKQHYLKTREFSPRTVARLIAQAEAVKVSIRADDRDCESYVATFCEWLVAHKGAESWDYRKIVEEGRRIESGRAKKDDEDAAAWIHGAWQDHISRLKDQSVRLLLTDPPYGVGYQSDYRLDRSQPRKHARIQGDEDTKALTECLQAMLPKLADDAHVLCFCCWTNEPEVRQILSDCGLSVRGSLVWVKDNTGMGDPTTTFAPKHERIIHAVKGSPVLFERAADVLECARMSTARHPTEKPVDLLKTLIVATTAEGELVADPFGGVASTLVAARELRRQCWGCETDEKYHHAGTERLSCETETIA